MNGKDFSDLITATAEMLKVSAKCENDAEAYVELDGFNIGMLLDTRLDPNPLRCYFDLGEVEPSETAKVCQALLSANLSIGSVGYGVFAWHEETAHPVMVLLIPDAALLDAVTFSQLLQDCVTQCAEVRETLILSRKKSATSTMASAESDALPKPTFGVLQYG